MSKYAFTYAKYWRFQNMPSKFRNMQVKINIFGTNSINAPRGLTIKFANKLQKTNYI